MDRRRDHYLMLLAISQNPHTDNPKDLWMQLRGPDQEYLDSELDKDGFDRLKQQLSGAGGIRIK